MPNNLERISNTDPFIDQYKWNGINFPSERKDHAESEKDILRIPISVLYISEDDDRQTQQCYI